jgi:putative MFS transporter
MAATSQTAALPRGMQLIQRMESVPFSPWHTWARIWMGSATFFDAFSALTIAFVLPALIGLWKLSPGQIGTMISVGYVGQIFGALFFGWLAERIGRTKAVACAMALDGVMSLCCAFFAGSFVQLAVFRTIQGCGLGGEVPVAAAYINELCHAQGRGRFVMLYESVFGIGILGAALCGIALVPGFGWQSMFVVGGVPALVIAYMVYRLPESPRWLIGKGRLDQAEAIVARVEASTPRRREVPVAKIAASAGATEQTRWREVLSPFYRFRTFIVWALWATTYFVYYGVGTWLPSIYRTVYHLSVKSSLRYGSIANVLVVVIGIIAALLVDKLGRKLWLGGAFLVSAALLLTLALLGAKTAASVVVFGSLAFAVLGSNATLLYLYTPEIYPTRMRAAGTGLATSWLRVASAVGPFLVGYIIKGHGIVAVFFTFVAVLVIGAIATLGATETRRRQLEELNP